MERKAFLSLLGLGIIMRKPPQKDYSQDIIPQQLLFTDDGLIPNSKYPLLLYKNVFSLRYDAGADWLQEKFAANHWSNSWRNGVFAFHHYHSISHEVLGVYSGEALLHLGGEKGQRVTVAAGDIIIIPAGVGHKNIGSAELGVLGAYPDGHSWDLNYGRKEERPKADQNIAAVAMPSHDPLLGTESGLRTIWLKI